MIESQDAEERRYRSRWMNLYNPVVLSLYDALIVHGTMPRVFHCPPGPILDDYRAYMSDCHLEVGFGSGYFVRRACRERPKLPELSILDVNAGPLRRAERSLSELSPKLYRGSVTELCRIPPGPFESIAIHGVLHCIDGSLEHKGSNVFSNLQRSLAPGGTLFGSTILADGVKTDRLSRVVQAFYNRIGAFDNHGDSLAGLKAAFEGASLRANVRVVGCFGIFSAVKE